MTIKAKNHPDTKPRGVRDPRKCKVQAGGRLVWIQDGEPRAWTDRPHKFQGHIQVILNFYARRGLAVELTDIKWQQLGSETWWRIPAWPDGIGA